MVDFTWSEIPANDSNKAGLPEDRLDRAKVAEFLTKYLVSEGVKRNYVLNVNASWGAGKTYFLTRWQRSIENDYPVVYIDAWQQDFSDDPLLTVVSTIMTQLKNQHGSQGDVLIHNATRGLVGLFKVAAPFVTKAVIKKITGIGFDDFSDELEKEDSLKATTDGVDTGDFDIASSEAAGKLVEGLLSDHASKKIAIEKFKIEIKKWADEVIKTTGRKPPVFIFIDELDRCRPSYAIEMLEVVKHLFDIEGVVFVLATDTSQLQHAVRVIYGAEFDASAYLGRFFNRRVTLKCAKIREYVQNLPQFDSLKESVIGKEGFWAGKLEQEDLLAQVCAPMESYQMDLRTCDRLVDRLVAILNSDSRRQFQVDIIFLMILLSINERDNQLYEVIANKQLLSHQYDLAGWENLVTDNKYKRGSKLDLTIPIRLRYEQHKGFDPNAGQHAKLEISLCNFFLKRLVILKENKESRGQYNSLLDSYERRVRETNTPDTAIILNMSRYYLDQGRVNATWSHYFDWVELASAFDE